MSQIFIANPTLHNRQLQIRVSANAVRIVDIRPYGQEMFPDDVDGALLGKVIKQIEDAGGVPSDDPKAIKGRFGLLYTVSDTKKSIDTGKINAGAKRDQVVRQDLAGDLLEKSAAAAFNVSQAVGGNEISFELTEVNDQSQVKGGVDSEITVGTKRNAGRGGRTTSRKR